MSDTADDLERRSRQYFHRLWSSFYSADSYGLVLLLIAVTYALSVSVTSRWAASVTLAIQVLTVWLALRTSDARRGFRVVAAILLVLSALIVVVNLLPGHFSDDHALVPLAAGALYLIAPISIVRHLALRRVIDLETFLGSVAAYLFIGMSFAFLYATLAVIQSGSFFGAQGDGKLSQDLFFSFTTLTTTGYGNLVPASNPGQTLAVAEMLLGQLFLITAVAKVVSGWRPKDQREQTEPGT
jgi:hypothetical protein